MSKYIGYSYYLKLGSVWLHLWGKSLSVREGTYPPAFTGFHKIIYLKNVSQHEHPRLWWIGASWPHMRENGCAFYGDSYIDWGDGTSSPMWHFWRFIVRIKDAQHAGH